MENRPLRIFLCHASQDKPKVIELYNRLKSEPWLNPWIDAINLLPGQDWDLEIFKAIRTADVIIVCFSENSTTKEGYIQREIKRALSFADEKPEGVIYIIPVRLDNAKLPIRFKQYHWLDYFAQDGHEKLLQSLHLRANELELFAPKFFKDLNLQKNYEYEKEYSNDLWDYLVDMPYMPSRADRDKLVLSEDTVRVQIWDYFFRIKIEDVGISQRQEISSIKKLFRDEEFKNNKEEVSKKTRRIEYLEHNLALLIKQIPIPPSDLIVRQWLSERIDTLIEDAKIVTGLSTQLINTAFPNPILLFAPGELQSLDRLPPTFTKKSDLNDTNFDIKKHLTARKSFKTSEGSIDILYGVYYFKCIVMGKDMLAINQLFYDFITGKSYAEEVTEQYYNDVVAITVASEFRAIKKGGKESKENNVFIENAPTFTLSLASGESRKFTTVNEEYFLKIKDEIGVAEEDIPKIFLIQNSYQMMDSVIRSLRSQLRIHKSIDDFGE